MRFFHSTLAKRFILVLAYILFFLLSILWEIHKIYILYLFSSCTPPRDSDPITQLNILCLFLEKNKKEAKGNKKKEKFLCVYAHFYMEKIIFLKIAYQLWLSQISCTLFHRSLSTKQRDIINIHSELKIPKPLIIHILFSFRSHCPLPSTARRFSK